MAKLQLRCVPTKSVGVMELQCLSAGVCQCVTKLGLHMLSRQCNKLLLWVVAWLLLQWNAKVLPVAVAHHPSTAALAFSDWKK